MRIVNKNPDHPNLDRFRNKSKSKVWLRIVGLLVLALAVWYGLTFFIAYNRATTTNITSGSTILKDATASGNISEPINILLIGIGGAGHDGADLADSIMVASIDVKHNEISLLSIPRDFYVPIPGHGKDKINAADVYGENPHDKGGGPHLLEQVVSSTLGIPIHYFIRMDFTGFKQTVDAIGGITVDVKTPLNDPLYPNDQTGGYSPLYVSAGVHNFNGDQALRYARSRETTSDFDRARRQQEVLEAIKQKAFTAQVLANPKKTTSIVSIVGQHMLTDFSAGEIEQMLKIVRMMNSPTINHEVIGNADNQLLVSGRAPNGGDVQIPTAGINNYSQIKIFALSYLAAPAIKSETATIELQKGTATKDSVAKLQKQLEWAGFTVTSNETATPTDTKTTLYDTESGKKSESLNFLNDVYHLSPKKSQTTDAPTSSSDFILVVGSDFATISKITPLVDTVDKPLKALNTNTPNETSLLESATVGTKQIPVNSPSRE